MTRLSLHPSAAPVAADLETAIDPVSQFVIQGGKLSFSNGTNIARLFGVSASCTVGEADAVKAWCRAVQRKAGAQ